MPNTLLISHLEMLANSKGDGQIQITWPATGDHGIINVQSGEIVCAYSNNLSGHSAVHAMLAWTDGSAEVTPDVKPDLINANFAIDLILFEFVQLEQDLGSDEAILQQMAVYSETSARPKRKTVILPDFKQYALYFELADPNLPAAAFELNPGIHRLGSSPDADIRLPYPGISRLQARVEIDPKSVTISDLGSTNGTWVNDVQIQTSLIFPGDKVHFGSVPFRFVANIRRKLTRATVAIPARSKNTPKKEVVHQAKTGVIHWSTLEKKSEKTPQKSKSIIAGLFQKKD
jgi:hypothetical protein